MDELSLLTEYGVEIGVVGAAIGFVSFWILEYTPGLSTWYNALTKETKKFTAVIATALVAITVLVLSCVGYLPFDCPDDDRLILWLLGVLVAVFSNKESHTRFKKSSE